MDKKLYDKKLQDKEIPVEDFDDEIEINEFTAIVNAMFEGKKLHISDVMKNIDQELERHQNRFFLIAGVGAGKSTWVKKVLAKKENVLFITSRRAKVDEDVNDSCFENFIRMQGDEHRTLITNAKLAALLKNFNLKDSSMTIDEFLDHYKYIVIDEVHSMISDSTYANSSFLLLNFIEYVAKSGRNIICMTGTPEPVRKYFEKNKWYILDFRKTCEYVKPKRYIAISNETIISTMKKELDKNNKIIYFVNNKSSFKELYKKIVDARLVNPKEISAIAATNKENKLEVDLKDLFGDENKAIIEKCKATYKSIIEEKMLPEDCKILLSTSKLREGIDIMNQNVVVICDNHVLTNIIQFCGRVRNGTEVAYIVEDSTPHPNEQEKILYKYSKEEAVAGNYFLKKYMDIEGSKFSNKTIGTEKSDKEKLIAHIENNKYCRFNYISNEFQRFRLLYEEETRLKKCLKNWKQELVKYCVDYGIQPPFFLPRKEILEEVLETLYKEKTKLYIHRDIKKIEALRNVIWHLPTEQKKFPKATKGLTKILHENKINYILDSVLGGAGKKEPETYWHVKK